MAEKDWSAFKSKLADMSHDQLGEVARRLEAELECLRAEVEGRPQNLTLEVGRECFPVGPWKIRVARVTREEF